MTKFKWEFGFDHTFTSQIELLPRITIRYDKDPCIAIYWLWFSMYVSRLGPDPRPRKVVCAALRHGATGALILGARHYDAIMHKHIRAAGGVTFWYGDRVQTGYIDQNGVFMNRREAADVAVAAGQIDRTAFNDRTGIAAVELASEDLY